MRILLGLLMIAVTTSQLSDSEKNKLKSNIDEDYVNNLEDDLEGHLQGIADGKDEEERKRLNDEYIEDYERALDNHFESKKVIEIGEFKIRLQKNCVLELPEEPEYPETEIDLECLTG